MVGAMHVAIRPRAAALFLVLLGTLAAPVRPARASILEQIQVFEIPDANFRWRDLAMSPQGNRVYLTADNSGSDLPLTGILVVYRRNADGTLTLIDSAVNLVDGVMMMRTPREIAVSPNGAHVYVTSTRDDSLLVFDHGGAGGDLRLVEIYTDGVGSVDGLDGAWSVAISPDGANLYVASANEDALVVFARDVGDGTLAVLEVLRDGEAGVDGLAVPNGLTLSPDGGSVYVTSGDDFLISGDNSIAVFDRNDADGRLRFLEIQRDGVDGVDGLHGVNDVEVSHDGTLLYATSGGGFLFEGDNAFAVFSRAPNGRLQYAGAFFDGVGSIDSFSGADGLAVDPDEGFVYVGACDDEALTAIVRSDATGSTTFFVAQVFRNEVNGIEGLSGPLAVRVSPDGRHLYLPNFSGEVAVFERLNIACGESVDGILDPSDPDGFGDGTWIDDYAFTLNEPAMVRIEMTAEGFDPFVAVETVSRVQVFNGTPPLTIPLDPGKYVVLANNQSPLPAGSYSYRLSISCATGPTATPTPSDTPTFTFTPSPSPTPTRTRTATSSRTPTRTGTSTRTSSASRTATRTRTTTATRTPTRTESPVETPTATASATVPTPPVDSFLIPLQAIFKSPGVGGARGVAVSPDGAHVYVAGSSDNAVGVFTRDPASGSLDLVEVKKDGADGVEGIAGARALLVTADGRYVYVAASGDHAVTLFRRDPDSGGLTFVESVVDGVNGVDGLRGARQVVISPDQQFLYVPGPFDDAIAVFRRDVETGRLTFVELQRDGVGGVNGLDGVRSVSISPDGAHLYAASIFAEVVAIFERDPGNGRLSFREVVDDQIVGTGLVVVDPNGNQVYAVGSGLLSGSLPASVATYDRDPGDGSLTLVEILRDGEGGVGGLTGATGLGISPDGRTLYICAFSDMAIGVFSRSELDGRLSFAGLVQDGVGEIDGLEGIEAVAVSPDGRHLYGAASVDDALTTFARAPDGALSFRSAIESTSEGLDGARGLAVSPDGKRAYVAGFDDDTLAVFTRGEGGRLEFRSRQLDGIGIIVPVDGLDGAASVAVTGDGSHVYVTGMLDDGIAAFAVDEDEDLLFVESEIDGIDGVDGLAGADGIASSPDDRHLYVAGRNDDAVAVFARDSSSGTLTFAQVVREGDGNTDGLSGASALVVSPEGTYVYVAGTEDHAVAIFQRESSSGNLTFVGQARQGVDGVNGLLGVRAVAISSDGTSLYAAGTGDDAVAAFERDVTNGSLSQIAVYRDGDGPIDGLAGVSSIAIDPSGALLFAVASEDAALTVFSRNVDDGRLRHVETWHDGVNGVDGLAGANSVSLGPAGVHVYVTSSVDDAVAVFGRRVAGDLNSNGVLEPTDLELLLSALFREAPDPRADVNLDARVGAADITALLDAIGRQAPSNPQH